MGIQCATANRIERGAEQVRKFIAEQGIKDVARNVTDNSSRPEEPTARQARRIDRAADDIRAASDSRIANPRPRWVPLQFRVRYGEK